MTARRPTAVLAVLIALVGAAYLAVTGLRSGGPEPYGPEAGFARDMSTHHAQAVRMAFAIRDRTRDESLRTMTYDIITTQQAQIGIMTAWLDAWDAPQADPRGPMRWMAGHTGHGGAGSAATTGTAMPGMATREQLAQLDAAPAGKTAEVLFLRLMIAHHRGGVTMAEAVLARTERPEVRRLARSIVRAQQSEIQLMNQMLTARGASAA